MKILAKGAVVLVLSLFALGAAQEATPPKGDGMTMGQGSMGQHNMNQGMTGKQQGMMQMMQACSNMMQMMQDEQMGMMSGQMDMKQMDRGRATPSAQFSKAAAKALARAFLTGRDAEATPTLQNVLPTEGGYTVAYLQGDTSGELLVDAATGQVQPRTVE